MWIIRVFIDLPSHHTKNRDPVTHRVPGIFRLYKQEACIPYARRIRSLPAISRMPKKSPDGRASLKHPPVYRRTGPRGIVDLLTRAHEDRSASREGRGRTCEIPSPAGRVRAYPSCQSAAAPPRADMKSARYCQREAIIAGLCAPV